MRRKAQEAHQVRRLTTKLGAVLHFSGATRRSHSLEKACTMDQERRGLRFAYTASAEIALANSPTVFFPARVTELSLRGCFLETSASFEIQRPVLVKINSNGEYFEAEASVLYVRPSGIGLVFGEVKPRFRAVLQKWVLSTMDSQGATSASE